MSGPPYPPDPAPGSSGIGQFAIGVSPIGTIAPFNWWTTVISEFANSAVLTAMLQSFNDAVDPTALLDDFFSNVQLIDTAVGEGLDVWGRILGVTRILNLSSGGKFFGFDEATTISADPFGQSPFYGGTQLTTNFLLADGPFRTLLFAKALANICDGSSKSINALLRALFPGRGNCYVLDGLNMTMTYNFYFVLTPVEQAIVIQSGVLPRTAGVASTIVLH